MQGQIFCGEAVRGSVHPQEKFKNSVQTLCSYYRFKETFR